MWRRGLAVAILICSMGGSGLAMAAPDIPPGPKPTAPGHRRCGTMELFRHRFPIEAQGIGCGLARKLLSRPCVVRLLPQPWTCSSSREDAPFLVWFPTEDLFKRNVYPAALLRRYPCSQAKVTPSLFGFTSNGFPTRRQLLADDVLRCELLGPADTSAEVEGTLGPPDEKEAEAGLVWFLYGLGPERSLIQVDSELLLIELKRDRVRAVEIVQG